MTKITNFSREDIQAMRITHETVIEEPFYDPHSKHKKAVTFGKWQVEPCGTMIYDNSRYLVEPSQLTDDDLVLHLFSKGWIDWNDFMPAYLQALKNIGVQTVGMKVFY